MARPRPELVLRHSADATGSVEPREERGSDPAAAATSLPPAARAYAALKARGWSHDRIVDELAMWVLDALRDGRIEVLDRTVGPRWTRR